MWVVEWIDEMNVCRRKEFEDKWQAEDYADDLFVYYPVRMYKVRAV